MWPLRIVLMVAAMFLAASCGGTSGKASGSPFFCNLNALDDGERARYAELSASLAGAIEDLRELPDGYAFRLGAAMPLSTAAQWAEFESRCCPFFDIRLEQARERGPLWLHLTGREGVKQFIRAEFRL